MKILYCAANMSHIEKFHIPYIEKLREDGHTVKIMAGGDGSDYDIFFYNKMKSREKKECRAAVFAAIKDGGFDAIVLNTHAAAYHVRRSLVFPKRPKVLYIAGGYPFEYKDSSIKKLFFMIKEKLLSKLTDSIIVMNEDDYDIALVNKLAKNPPVKIAGLGARVAPVAASREQIREEMLSKNKFVIAFVGDLCDDKNQKMLIEAMPQIKEKIPSAMLWLVGEGGKKRELIALANSLGLYDSVIFAGRRSNPCDFMRACDLYVSASRVEGMPFNIVEALGCGARVLCSNIKGHRDIIHDGKEGFLFESESREELVRRVVQIYEKDLQIDERLAARAYKEHSFDEVFYANYTEIIKALE